MQKPEITVEFVQKWIYDDLFAPQWALNKNANYARISYYDAYSDDPVELIANANDADDRAEFWAELESYKLAYWAAASASFGDKERAIELVNQYYDPEGAKAERKVYESPMQNKKLLTPKMLFDAFNSCKGNVSDNGYLGVFIGLALSFSILSLILSIATK